MEKRFKNPLMIAYSSSEIFRHYKKRVYFDYNTYSYYFHIVTQSRLSTVLPHVCHDKLKGYAPRRETGL